MALRTVRTSLLPAGAALAAAAAFAAEVPVTDAMKHAIARAIEEYAASLDPPCARLELPWRAPGFVDTELGATPATFRVRVDPASERKDDRRLAAILALGERHGLFERLGTAPPEYGLTWKGYAASDGAGCFLTGSREPEVTVHSARASGKYSVSASARPARLEPWAADPEFAALFAGYHSILGVYERRSWQLERSGSGFQVERHRGRSPETLGVPYPVLLFGGLANATRPRQGPPPEEFARLAGPLTEARVLEAVKPVMHAPEASRTCLRLTNLGDRNVTREEPSLWFFDRDRSRQDAARVRGDLELVRRLVALGLLEGRRVAPGDHATPGMRYDLTEAGRAMAAPDDPTCLVAGHQRVAAVLRFEPFTPARPHPVVIVRSTFEVMPGREKLVAAFGHLTRLAAVGGGGVARLTVNDERRLAGHFGAFEQPAFHAGPNPPPLPEGAR